MPRTIDEAEAEVLSLRAALSLSQAEQRKAEGERDHAVDRRRNARVKARLHAEGKILARINALQAASADANTPQLYLDGLNAGLWQAKGDVASIPDDDEG